jgi:hypothetical protein
MPNEYFYHLYHGKNMLHLMRQCLLCARSCSLVEFHIARSLKQQSAGRHVTPLRHIIMIPSHPVFAVLINTTCFAEIQ